MPRGAAAYICNARGPSASRRLSPAAACRTLLNTMRSMVRNRMHPGVRIVLDRTDDYVCGACGLILVGDLREVCGHVHDAHGGQSFVLEECAPGPGGFSGGEEG